jgi:hypothetical protein
MKWITPLWSNPVGWSEQVAKTKLRVFLWTLIHLCFVSGGFVGFYWSLQVIYKFRDTPSLIPSMTFLALVAGACPIVFIGVVYPAMYLYAMHRLLVMLKAQGKASSDERPKSQQ